jgi:protein-S-isoprenylcysteine O-methyltransferase Ste14
MSLVPVFELGLWNAWLLILPFLILNYGISFAVVERKSALFVWPTYTPSEKQVMPFSMGLFLINAVYSVFLPLQTGALWLIAGLIIYGLGMLFVAGGIARFSSTPVEQPNTTGVYRFSRNPMYFGFFLVFLGAGIAGASWLMILLALIVFVLQDRFMVPPEERMCLDRYGEVYRAYMDKTAKWIGPPKA